MGEIRNSSQVIFSSNSATTIKMMLEEAVKIQTNLFDAYLIGAYLGGANLSNANLTYANLKSAHLAYANLSGANLCYADLSCVNLRIANLDGANLRYADLSGANLDGANLSGANLNGANLTGADLRGAYLYGVNFHDANLSGINLNDLSQAQLSIVPETGAFEGWKKCQNNIIVRLAIPAEARRSNSTGRTCRAEFVTVLEVIGDANEGISCWNSSVVYRVGETVRCHEWNENRWIECGGGIHFYITRTEAENH